ncbi:putative chromatin regulator PHD family [Lupinus albus]|uniref:Putative chromatin regulator PHD family n=1 Tax=Lupinus albus TaxID=3870 RepID=A0A6A4PR83_LUPAL|nr:putative chromatin regulator PHD family [Lupinus albus]
MVQLLCTFLLPAMNGCRSHRRTNMRDLENLSAEETSCTFPVDFPAYLPEIAEDSSAKFGIDFFSQARKALSERSPFDVVAGETSTSAAAVTLPSELANLLNRHGDKRWRHKKSSHASGGGEKKKKSSRAGEKAHGSNIWTEMEVYFRDLTLSDIDTLAEASSLCNLTYSECFSIPRLGNALKFDAVSSNDEKIAVPTFNLGSNDNKKNVVCGNEKNADEDAIVADVKIEDGFVGIESDNVAADTVSPLDDETHANSDTCDSLEWLLGCRNKISLTSERPSKKRKLLGGDVGLEKVAMACDVGQPFCDYCSRGDTGNDSNQLISCTSCKVVVHQKCYGVQDNANESWLCSWCKQKTDIDELDNHCVLCPKKGGALKPVNGSIGNVGSVQFAHLFCGLWMPEVYIDDLKKMEPVMNVGEIKENRWKLVCNVCKVKCGACVRCSHGTCRASFHPLCAREARHRMEVWARHGDDDVELRAFCLKHSDLQENRSISPSRGSVAIGELSEANDPPATLPLNSTLNLKIGVQNGDVVSDSSPDKLNHTEPQDGGLSDCRLSAHGLLGCGAVKQHNIGVVGKTNENVDASDSLTFALILKKLIDRGKVDAKDVALEIGISPDTLTENINEAYIAPDVRDKIVNWLKAHVYTTAFHKGVKVKIKPANASTDESGAADGSENLPKSDSGLLDPIAVKSVPQRRRTVSNIRILKDKMIYLSNGVTSKNGMPVDKISVDQTDHENPGISNEASVPGATEMNLTKSEDFCPAVQDSADISFKSSISGCVLDEESTTCLQNSSMLSDQQCPLHPASKPPDSGFIKKEVISCYVHPYIKKTLQQVRDGVPLDDIICPREEGKSSVKFSGASDCSSSHNQQLPCVDFSKPGQVNKDQLARARKMELLEFSPEDEVEGELIYYQHRLFQDRVAKKRLTDNLIHNIVKRLPQEIDMAHQRRWDAVIVNRYLRDLKEAKKQGRKERRHKEAHAVLAAATAAAAASTRVSSFRKDTLDESMQKENLLKLDALSGRNGASSQPMPRVKETLSRVAVTRTSSEKYSDFGLSTSNFSKEQPKSCNICRRPETMLNPILVCSGCKVAVHLDCYRSVKETMGPWYCELCEDLSSRSSATCTVNFWEKPYFVVECALCGGTTGAFRRSSDGQWVHAFCAEWVFESTFRRGQINSVEGVETVLKGTDICCICCRKHGVCMKCCYGHCRTTFHPSCARSAGWYMNVRTAGGKLQHKAYCEKHSLEQKEKADKQKYGIEEFKRMKQIRVELERLRLLCERIVKREKIKRELILCSHDKLAFERDHVARSMMVHSPLALPDGSSGSAATSLIGNTEGYRSCSEAVQRSDDVTVDSSASAKHRVRVAVSMDTDPKVDDGCSTSQRHYDQKIPEKLQFSGKQIPRRAFATLHYHSDEGGRRSKSRKVCSDFKS